MNSAGWKAEQRGMSPVSGHPGDQHLETQSLPELDTAKMDPSPSGGSHHQMKEKDCVAEWYEISWPLDRSSVTACSCSGNCLSTCPARNELCPNPAASARQTWGKRVISSRTACRCRVLGCLSFARRPFGPHSSAQNHGKRSKHWVLDDSYLKNQLQKHSHHRIQNCCEPARKQKGTSREPTGNQPRANSEPTANQQRTSTKPAAKPRQGIKDQQQNHWQHGSEIDVSKHESNNESTVNQQGTTMEPAWKQQQTR